MIKALKSSSSEARVMTFEIGGICFEENKVSSLTQG